MTEQSTDIKISYLQNHFSICVIMLTRRQGHLSKILSDPERINVLPAARSLEEGLEDILTQHWSCLHEIFPESFATTNRIESLNENPRFD